MGAVLHSGRAELLLERDRELESLRAALAEAAAGEGRLALVEGPAGIGKTRLLAELRLAAEEDGVRVLSARGSELEREFPFGVVRQLFEPALSDDDVRERWLAGAAAAAEPIFGAAVPDSPAVLTDASFAALHGLYWLTANAAADGPLLLSVDDLHWCDRPSLRFLAYLARRLEDTPVVVGTTLRNTDPGTDPALIAEIGNEPATRSVSPGPLSADAVAAMVRARLGEDADPRFCAACARVTGGNPLLLRQLLTSLEADGVQADAASVDVVTEIGPRAVSRTVLIRLARLPGEAVSVARAVAVLGESADLPTVAALAELPEQDVAAQTAVLARAEILRDEPPLGFVHPLVRDAVYHELAPAQRELMHSRAAQELRDAGAPADQVASHLLSMPRRGEQWVANILVQAAHAASRRGAPESAVTYLTRALEEPPPPEWRAEMLLELGMAGTNTYGPAAIDHLREAYDLLDDPRRRALAAFVLARTLLFAADPDAAAAFAHRAAADLPEDCDDERQALVAVELSSANFNARVEDVPERLLGLRDQRFGDGPGARMLAGATAFGLMGLGRSRERTVELALHSVEDRSLFEADNGLFWMAATLVLANADHPEMPALWAETLDHAHRNGSLFSQLSMSLWDGAFKLAQGELAEAEELLRTNLVEAELYGLKVEQAASYTFGFLGGVLLERGDLAGAREAIAHTTVTDGDTSDGTNFVRRTAVGIQLASGDGEGALAAAEDYERHAERVRNPSWAPWRAMKAQALTMLGRRDEAIELAREEVELAREWGAPTGLGRSLRVLGELLGKEGMAELEEAVELLESSGQRIERARALAALGAELRRARRPTDAREPLRRALEICEITGAKALEDNVRSELYATGARPRTTALSGVESLTERELRVATLAADGQTNRDIAQALYVTPKTVEVHLSNAYRKLDIASRRELPAALMPSTP
jgi:DNA-binding NarL/FixJ family response regulator